MRCLDAPFHHAPINPKQQIGLGKLHKVYHSIVLVLDEKGNNGIDVLIYEKEVRLTTEQCKHSMPWGGSRTKAKTLLQHNWTLQPIAVVNFEDMNTIRA